MTGSSLKKYKMQSLAFLQSYESMIFIFEMGFTVFVIDLNPFPYESERLKLEACSNNNIYICAFTNILHFDSHHL